MYQALAHIMPATAAIVPATPAITNPLHAEEMTAILGADVAMGHDENCMRWIQKFREPAAEGDEGARGRREGRRRRA